jgi:DUF4097 and DUF4098 domain-containing protein YvlB
MVCWGLPAILVFGLAGCDIEDFGPSNRFQENFTHTYALKSGGRVSVEGFNGSIEVFGWDRESVEVSGTKYSAREETLASIKVDVQAGADSVVVRTSRPERRGNMGVRFTIHVPRKTTLERIQTSNGSIRAESVDAPARLETSNGAVRVSHVASNLEVRTSNGSIEVRDTSGRSVLRTSNGAIRADDLKGSVEASTSNGSIEIGVTDAQPAEMRVSTTNGSITVRLPASANARIDASTSNSSITSEFDVRSGRVSKTHLDGVIGSGGPTLDLSTSNGSIRLLKR